MIYEIYPRSFQDSNGDGLGDLNGITQRLDYLNSLGVDCIWISPMYPSPQVDFGYDVSNYTDVDPAYGTLKDMDHLIAEAKKRNIRVVLDFVANHTSSKHAWFLESSSSRTNPKADWYVWNDGIAASGAGVTDFQRKYQHDGVAGPVVPPNNWVSLFGGSAWEWSEARKQFYYHKFYMAQPDLNWRNPAVEKAMFDSMRFWLDRGVAGFRLDAIDTIYEDPQLRNEPLTGGKNVYGDPQTHTIYTGYLPEVFDLVKRMRELVDSYPGDRILIGETNGNAARLNQWYGGPNHDRLQLPMDQMIGMHSQLKPELVRQDLNEVEDEVYGSQPLLVFDNHDQKRSWDRLGDGIHNDQIARAVAMILFTTRSTAMLYEGQEIGMTDHTPARVEDVRDPIGVTGWPKEKGRDGERTPMQWTPGPQAGFSTNPQTWLPVGSDYKTINVQTESGEQGSLLAWYKQLIRMRRTIPALHDGGSVTLDAGNGNVIAYLRTAPTGAKPVVVALNLSAQAQVIHLDLRAQGIKRASVKTLLANDASVKPASLNTITLPPYGSWIGEVR